MIIFREPWRLYSEQNMHKFIFAQLTHFGRRSKPRRWLTEVSLKEDSLKPSPLMGCTKEIIEPKTNIQTNRILCYILPITYTLFTFSN